MSGVRLPSPAPIFLLRRSARRLHSRRRRTRVPRWKRIWIAYLNALDVAALELTDDEIVSAVEEALAAQGRGETVIEPRVHLVPESTEKGHFNVLRGSIAPLGVAGVKVVGDFIGNYRLGLPSEMALLNLFDPETGMPKAVLDATSVTDMRTGAMTGDRRQVSRPGGLQGARAYRCPGNRLLECPVARPPLRLRGDPGPLAPPGESGSVRGASRGGARQADRGHRQLARLPGGGRHSGGGLAPGRAGSPCSEPNGSRRGRSSSPTAR